MLLVVGWDGASFDLVDPLVASGRMPVLAGLLARGARLGARSTVPAVTFPAWTSFLTGAHPSHHGITDFTIPREGSYGVRFANASHRRLPTILARMADAGVRAGMYGVPATYPPEGRAVFEICGFDTPLGAAAASRTTHPPGLAEELRRRHGRLGIEGIAQSRIDDGWHERVRTELVRDVEARTSIALDLVRGHALDVFVVHFMEPDTASHHFRQFDDEASPRHRDGPRGVIAGVYEALDRSLGELIAACGRDADVLVLSDHGSAGASDRIVFWNRWLADRGWLAFRGGGGSSAAAVLKRAAMAIIPPPLQSRAFSAAGGLADRIESGARFAGIDWARTRVYSDETPYLPSLRLNLRGRESAGTVAAGGRTRVIEDVTRDLLEARDPIDGGAVVEAVHRREDLFDGPYAHRYPDLVLELRNPAGYAYAAASSRGGQEREWLRRLRPEEMSGARGSTTGGVHGPLGIAVLAGPAVEARGLREAGECSLADLGVTVLDLAGVAPTDAMQGRSVLAGAHARAVAGPGDLCASPEDYGEEEERVVEERLRALGYLP